VETLLVSGFGTGAGAGGLFLLDEGACERLDTLSSTGIAVADGRVARLLRSATELYGSELLVYDRRGIERYVRLDEVIDPHDIVWDGSHYVVASTTTNSVFWLSPTGEVMRRWKAPGEGDAWHLNSLVLVGEKLYAAAFGRFERHREWVEHRDEDTGFVLDLRTGEEIHRGLRAPHHPRKDRSSWFVCNSGTREVVELDGRGGVIRRLELRSWTRGLAVSERFLHVGESEPRDEDGGSATVAVVDRDAWRVAERIEVPCDEIYDIVPVEHALVEGLRRGFRTNPVRTAEQDQLALFDQAGVHQARLWGISIALPPEACRVSISADVPRELTAGSWNELECRIENHGSAVFVTAPPNPVHISYWWSRDGRHEEGERSVLPHPVPPGAAFDCRFGLAAPTAAGNYELHLTLVQEGIAWFNDLDARNACSALVRVV
jgi:hypothetical protein